MKHLTAGVGSLALLVGVAHSNPPQEVVPPTVITQPADARAHGLESLRSFIQSNGIPGPDESDLGLLVRNPQAARVLGKALFWDMAVGSDGIQACASCHFHAGVDNRVKNQVNPNLTRVEDTREGDVIGLHNAAGAPDTLFEIVHPNGVLERADFPFVRDIGNGDNVLRSGNVLEPAPGNSNDVSSSQGVRLTRFDSAFPGADVDAGTPLFDPVFNDGNGTVFRRVEPRNTPTVINSVFNFHNFWDGRANNRFNGVNPFGKTDPSNPKIWVAFEKSIQPYSVDLRNSSLASQAVGPPLSDFEMSFAGRTFPDLGRRLIPRQALANQDVHPQDSLLRNHRHPSGKGLRRSYQELIQVAFQPWLWRSRQRVYYPADGGAPSIVTAGTTPEADTFHIGEANFALFFGIAVQMYEATLVSDDTPFDRWMVAGGPRPGFREAELAGLNVFTGKGKCVNCHSGPELTGASVSRAQNGDNLLEIMAMGDQRAAIYDNGYYNIAVTPTSEDIGRGGKGPGGYPLSSSRQLLFQNLMIQDIPFEIIGESGLQLVEDPNEAGVFGVVDEGTGEFIQVCRDLDGDGMCTEADEAILQRVAVDGAFKTPGLRNQLLMGPYFHNGSAATLREVVEFYDRGGNFCRTNGEDLDPDITGLGLTDEEKDNLVAFMISLTDDRVVHERAPFDHPQLLIPDGHYPDGTTILREIPAVGSQGGPAIQPFLEADPFGANPVTGEPGADGEVECSPNFQTAE